MCLFGYCAYASAYVCALFGCDCVWLLSDEPHPATIFLTMPLWWVRIAGPRPMLTPGMRSSKRTVARRPAPVSRAVELPDAGYSTDDDVVVWNETPSQITAGPPLVLTTALSSEISPKYVPSVGSRGVVACVWVRVATDSYLHSHT